MQSLFDQMRDKPQINNKDLLDQLITKKARQLKYPYSIRFELTPLCTLNCKMCYARLDKETVSSNGDLLSVSDWVSIAEQAWQLGSRVITLTGGECLIYEGFCELYEKLYDIGYSIHVMTNATVISEEIYALFKRCPPDWIFITVYGAKADTYHKLCGNGEIYYTVLKNVERLRAEGHRLHLITTVTKLNCDDVKAISDYAAKIGTLYNFDGTLSVGRESTHETVTELGLSFRELEKVTEQVYGKFNDMLAEPVDTASIIQCGMMCGAGRSMFHITWNGDMQPCVLLNVKVSHPLVDGVKKAWDDVVSWAEGVQQLTECQACQYRMRCAQCISIHYNDTNEFGKPSPRLCYKIQHNIKD